MAVLAYDGPDLDGLKAVGTCFGGLLTLQLLKLPRVHLIHHAEHGWAHHQTADQTACNANGPKVQAIHPIHQVDLTLPHQEEARHDRDKETADDAIGHHAFFVSVPLRHESLSFDTVG